MFVRLRRVSILLLLAVGFDRVFRTTAAGLGAEWMSSPESSYGLVLAAAALVIGASRWRPFLEAATSNAGGIGGLVLVSLAGAMYAIGQLGADVFLTRLSMMLFIAGAIWAVCGWRSLRVVAAPIVFLLIAVPLPALVINEITLPLQLAASRVAEVTLAAASVPVYRDGNLLALPSATLQVAEACSGLRSAVSLGGVGVLLAWATEPTWPRRAALVAATLPIAIVMNGFRVAATGAYTETFGYPPSGDLHSFMGWVTFVASVAVLMALQRLAPASPAARTRGPKPALVGETA
jgi:exosortase